MEGEALAAGLVLVLVTVMVVFVAEFDAGVIFVESDAAAAELVTVTVGGVVTAVVVVAVLMTAAAAVADAVVFVVGEEEWVPEACHSGTLTGLLDDTYLPAPSPQSWVPCQAE